MFKYHVLALLLGTILDYFFGRIYSLWNPFDSIKKMVKFLDRALLGDEIILLEPSKQKNFGCWLIILVLFPVFALISFFTMLCFEISPVLGIIFEAVASYYCLEGRYLFYGARTVSEDYYGDGLIVMKATAQIFTEKEIDDTDSSSISQQVITHLSNEASDAVLSPFLILFLFGPIGGFIYRTIDIIDKQVGHLSKRYEYFGYYPARLNHLVDYLPGRFSGAITVLAARYTFGDFNGKNARYIHMRDKTKAISAYAGALGIKLKDGTIGDADKEAEPKDIKRATALLRNTFLLSQCILLILLIIF